MKLMMTRTNSGLTFSEEAMPHQITTENFTPEQLFGGCNPDQVIAELEQLIRMYRFGHLQSIVGWYPDGDTEAGRYYLKLIHTSAKTTYPEMLGLQPSKEVQNLLIVQYGHSILTTLKAAKKELALQARINELEQAHAAAPKQDVEQLAKFQQSVMTTLNETIANLSQLQQSVAASMVDNNVDATSATSTASSSSALFGKRT